MRTKPGPKRHTADELEARNSPLAAARRREEQAQNPDARGPFPPPWWAAWQPEEESDSAFSYWWFWYLNGFWAWGEEPHPHYRGSLVALCVNMVELERLADVQAEGEEVDGARLYRLTQQTASLSRDMGFTDRK